MKGIPIKTDSRDPSETHKHIVNNWKDPLIIKAFRIYWWASSKTGNSHKIARHIITKVVH